MVSLRKIYLVISFMITLLAAIITEYYFLLLEGLGNGVVRNPTPFGQLIVYIIVIVPIIAVLYNLLLLFVDRKLPVYINIYLTSVIIILSFPFSVFLILYLTQVTKETQMKLTLKYMVISGVVILLWGLTLSLRASHYPFITNYRPSVYTIHYSNEIENGVEFIDFNTEVYFFNEQYDYAISDYQFQLIDTEAIDVDALEYTVIEYDILVDDLYVCKDKTSSSLYFDDYCQGLRQEGAFFYGDEDLSLTIRVRFYNDERLVLKSDYTVDNFFVTFRKIQN